VKKKQGVFMKKQIAVAMGLAVLSGSALASKARLQALGEDANGSGYINDNRNIFYNPAQVNNHKDMVTFEQGETEAVTASDQDATPNAEGGFLRQQGNLVYGLHFGAFDNTWNAIKAFSSNASQNPVGERNIWDFFIGGDAGMQWGAGLTYGSYKKTHKVDTTGSEEDDSWKSDTMRLRFGVVHGDLQVGLRYGLTNKSSFEDGEATTGATEDVTVNGKSDIDLNVAYNYNDLTFLLDVVQIAAAVDGSEDNLGGTGEDESETYKYNMTKIGVAKLQKINDTARANYKLEYMMADETNGGVDAAAGTATNLFEENDKDSDTALTATLGLEVDVKSWLTLRGSVSHDIMNSNKDVAEDTETVETGYNSTDLAAGASLMFGDFQVDGLIMTDDTGDNTGAEDGVLRTDALMSRVSMTYRF
jgi:hypothetical protein